MRTVRACVPIGMCMCIWLQCVLLHLCQGPYGAMSADSQGLLLYDSTVYISSLWAPHGVHDDINAFYYSMIAFENVMSRTFSECNFIFSLPSVFNFPTKMMGKGQGADPENITIYSPFVSLTLLAHLTMSPTNNASLWENGTHPKSTPAH